MTLIVVSLILESSKSSMTEHVCWHTLIDEWVIIRNDSAHGMTVEEFKLLQTI